MKEIRISVWKAVMEQSAIMMKEDESLVMYKDSEQLFHQNCDYYYSLVLDKFMKLRDEHLDRHKIAAVVICSILKSNVLGIACGKKGSQTIDDLFLANEKLALNIALSDMYQRLKAEYQVGKIPYENMIEEYIFPRPLSCDREYTEVICRDLYFAKKHFELNPLSIANFLFLLEAYSFEVSKISIDGNKWEMLSDIRHKNQCKKELRNIDLYLLELDEKTANKKIELAKRKAELQEELNNFENP